MLDFLRRDQRYVNQVDPLSPCTGVCKLHQQHKFCRGCYRTIEEIASWRDFSDEEKQTILATCTTRRAMYPD